MALEGFIIGMVFAGLALIAMWALANVGLLRARKKHVPFKQRKSADN